MADYAFDPDFAEMMDLLPAAIGDMSDPASFRDFGGEGGLSSLMPGGPPDGSTAVDRQVPGLDGDPDVPVRVFTPTAPAEGLRGAMLHIHGGGFIMGSVEMFAPICHVYASECDIVVVSVEYRLAPEDPYPAALRDCYAALGWLHDHAAELGVDPSRIGIGGESAGGGLSAALALKARDEGGPPVCFQLLQIPELDDRLATPSMTQFTDTPLWNRPNAEWSWKHYLGELHGSGDVPYLAAPARCTDLRGLPPAYITTMEFDPLRDEGIQYAMDLLRDGVQVELHNYPGTFHGSSLFSHAEVSQRDHRDTVRALRRALNA